MTKRTVEEFHSQNNLFETKLFETMTLVDLRNKTLIEFEEQMDRMKFELINKHKELLDKQTHINELEQIVIDKTAEVAQLTETLETGLVKSHHREKYAEDNATKAMKSEPVFRPDLLSVPTEFHRVLLFGSLKLGIPSPQLITPLETL